jgi:hypothetical protein
MKNTHVETAFYKNTLEGQDPSHDTTTRLELQSDGNKWICHYQDNFITKVRNDLPFDRSTKKRAYISKR